MNQSGLYAVLGALTADAASLGLHRLYDTRRLDEIIASSGKPGFLEPKRENYEGYFGYFAHAGRQAGDCSHYGGTIKLVSQKHDVQLKNSGLRFRIV
jgi:hypothetical protein